MLGRAKPFVDDQLGAFTRSRGAWRATIELEPHGSVPLAVPGPRSAPDDAALVVARSIADEYNRCHEAITNALDEHRAAAVEADGASSGDRAPSSASVVELDGSLTIQLAYRVDWDDDHTLGACLRDGELIELNGSIIEP